MRVVAIGAQRAVTGTLGAVVSNVIVGATTIVAMLVLKWRLTLLALVVLPLFVVPAKRVGRRLQDLTREQMNLNASMNTTMTERFGVAGDARQAVRPAGPGGRRVRRPGLAGCGHRRAHGALQPDLLHRVGLVGLVGTALIYWVGGLFVISGVVSIGTLVALGTYVTRIYTPLTSLTNALVDLMTVFVSFDWCSRSYTPNPIQDRPGAVDLVAPEGRIELDDVRFTYPTTGEASVASLEMPGAQPEPAVRRPGAPGADRGAGAGLADRAGRTVWAGAIHPGSLLPRLLRRHQRRRADRRHRRPAPISGRCVLRSAW